MKRWRIIQKIAVAVGMIYGLWLGGQVDATNKDNTTAFIMVMLAVIIALTLCVTGEDGKQEKSL